MDRAAPQGSIRRASLAAGLALCLLAPAVPAVAVPRSEPEPLVARIVSVPEEITFLTSSGEALVPLGRPQKIDPPKT